MRIWIRNFFISFAISLIVFAIPAYFIVNYALGAITSYDTEQFTTAPATGIPVAVPTGPTQSGT